MPGVFIGYKLEIMESLLMADEGFVGNEKGEAVLVEHKGEACRNAGSRLPNRSAKEVK